MPYSKSNKKIQDSAFKMKGFSGFVNSPLKQDKKIDHVGRTVDKLHSNEKKIGELKKSRTKEIKKVKGNTVKISKKEVLKQMKTAGTKLPYSSVKNALKTSIKAAGKVAKFIPGVGTAITIADMLTSKTATATKPVHHGAKKKGSYTDDFTKLRK